MSLSKNDALEQQLNAIEAQLNALTGAVITEAWVLCPIAPKRPDSTLAAAWLTDCGVKAESVRVLPHRSPNGRQDICFVALPGFTSELPEPWMYVQFPTIGGEDSCAWMHTTLNDCYRKWRQTCA